MGSADGSEVEVDWLEGSDAVVVVVSGSTEDSDVEVDWLEGSDAAVVVVLDSINGSEEVVVPGSELVDSADDSDEVDD